jgi:hypothetical protein
MEFVFCVHVKQGDLYTQLSVYKWHISLKQIIKVYTQQQSWTAFCFVKDGKARSATLVCAFLMFVNLFSKPEDAAQMFAVKRMPPGLHPSEMRWDTLDMTVIFSDLINPVQFHS